MAIVFAAMGPAVGAAELPGRAVSEYAITSANGEEMRDPSAWELFGSNDNGQTWTLLDTKTNQLFTARRERKLFPIPNRIAFNIYRLRVNKAKGSPDDTRLAELELIGPVSGVDKDARLFSVITSSREHPNGPALMAFDEDPSTSWFDYALSSPERCWIQCRYSLKAEPQVTRVSQAIGLARVLTESHILEDRARSILSNLNASATQTRRTLTGYALVSANDGADRDPRDWHLMGSNDGGKNWETLDTRHDEIFPSRFDRRVFTLANPKPFSVYRFEVDRVRTPGYANSVQLAEVEPLYASQDAGGSMSLVISAKGDNPPLESSDRLFDGDSKTKWLDFSQKANTNRSSWVQWQYLPGEQDLKIINLDQLRATQNRARHEIPLQIDGIAVSWFPESKTLGLLDDTGFQLFRLSAVPAHVAPGERIRLSGHLRFNRSLPMINNCDLFSRGSLPKAASLSAEQSLLENEPFFWSTVEGRVASLSQDDVAATIELKTGDDLSSVSAKLVVPGHVAFPSMVGCRLRVEGVVQPLFNDLGQRVPGVVWVDGFNPSALTLPAEKEWKALPEFTTRELSGMNLSLPPGQPLRVRGVTLRPQSDGSWLASQGTNEIVVFSRQAGPAQAGAPVEIAGIYSPAEGSVTLRKAKWRLVGESERSERETRVIDRDNPVTQFSEVFQLAGKRPGQPALPVRLRGVVTYIDQGFADFYLQDGTNCIQFGGQFNAGFAPFLRQEGSYVEVTGHLLESPLRIFPTQYATFLGRGRMPEPVRHAWDYLMTGADDNRWIEIEGVVREVEEHRMVVTVNGGQITVWINEIGRGVFNTLLGSVVRVRGVCAPVMNDRNQRLAVRLLTPSSEYVEVVTAPPADPFNLAAVPLSQVMRSDPGNGAFGLRLVKTTGVVTYSEPRFLFLQDVKDGLRVFPRREGLFSPGDRVEVVGLPAPDGFSPKLVQVGSSRVDLQACKLEYSIVSPK